MNYQEEIKKAVENLKAGKTLLLPTDTVWGISCDATNPEAVDKIKAIKQRDDSKSFIVLLNSDRMINKHIKEIPSLIWDLLDIEEQPLTLVLEGGQHLAPSVINNDGTIAVRMLKSGVCHDILKRFGKPIVSTSANFSEKNSPLTYPEIDPELKQKIDYEFPDSLANKGTNKPSKILKIMCNGDIEILRK